MRRRLGRVEQRVTGPHILDVLDPSMRMLEQVRGLRIDLERVLLIQQARVESAVGHHPSVLQPNTMLHGVHGAGQQVGPLVDHDGRSRQSRGRFRSIS